MKTLKKSIKFLEFRDIRFLKVSTHMFTFDFLLNKVILCLCLQKIVIGVWYPRLPWYNTKMENTYEYFNVKNYQLRLSLLLIWWNIILHWQNTRVEKHAHKLPRGRRMDDDSLIHKLLKTLSTLKNNKGIIYIWIFMRVIASDNS